MISTSVIRKRPNSGMKRIVAAPVCRSSQASSQGDPTRRTCGEGSAGCLEGQGERIDRRQCAIALGGRIHAQLERDAEIVIAQQAGAAEQRRPGREGAHALGFGRADFPGRSRRGDRDRGGCEPRRAESSRARARVGRRRAATPRLKGSGASSMMSACSPSGNRRSNSNVARATGSPATIRRSIAGSSGTRRAP